MKFLPHEGTVRVGVAAAIPGILEKLGQEPGEVFTEANIDLELFDDQDNLISYAARSHLLDTCVRTTGCEHFGLLLGEHGSLSTFGLIGHLAQQSTDVGSALNSLQHFFHLHAQGGRIETVVEGRFARLSYHIYEPQAVATRQIEDGAMAWGFNILRELCGDRFPLRQVQFVHGVPRDKRPYDRYFNAPLIFNSEQVGLYFPAGLLKRPLRRADPDLHRLLQKEVNRVQATYHDDFLSHCRRILQGVLWVRPATADDLASLFSMSSRTLNRRLSAVGTNFRKISEEVKQQIACRMLSDSDIQLTDLADLLHYHDASSFIKAFKRWTGATPARWRQRNKTWPR